MLLQVFNVLQLMSMYSPDFQLLLAKHQVPVPARHVPAMIRNVSASVFPQQAASPVLVLMLA